MFESEEFDEARVNLIVDICSNMLYFHPHQIKIFSVRSSAEWKSGILYVKTTENYCRELFIRAAKVQNDNISIIQYTPAAAIPRKRALERTMALIRNKAPLGVIKTQLRPGKNDYVP